MFKADVATLFPDMCESVLSCSIVGRARKFGLVDVNVYDIRNYSLDKHKKVDDYPYGGGRGMLMRADPIYRCYDYVCFSRNSKPVVVYLSPKGVTFSQAKALEYSRCEQPLFLLCGHYEGVDQRLIDEIVDEAISIGDYVVTGGELPALVVLDSIIRLVPSVLSSEECFAFDSHFDGLLEYPQYTRPQVWHNVKVPDVLLSGHHENIKKWRLEKSLELTAKRRPDILGR